MYTGSVRRPSLELVDSSSFRTHSSDVSPDQDHSPNGSDIPESIARGNILSWEQYIIVIVNWTL